MVGAGSSDLTGRYQFRLDLRDPRQRAFADWIDALPKGQRNKAIVDKLTAPESGVDPAVIKEAMREVLLEYGAVPPAQAAYMPEGRPPDELFDTSLFG